jgi:hypothetical protein
MSFTSPKSITFCGGYWWVTDGAPQRNVRRFRENETSITISPTCMYKIFN